MPKPEPIAIPKQKAIRASLKLKPPVILFLHENRHLKMPELLRKTEETIGVKLAAGTVYKAWKMERPECSKTFSSAK
jgi:hypothetical protein